MLTSQRKKLKDLGTSAIKFLKLAYPENYTTL